MATFPAADPRAFWSLVDKRGPGGCWIWKGPKDGSGYGRARSWWGSQAAHRVAHGLSTEYAFGRLRHECGNRACVNPDHLQEERERTLADRLWAKVRTGGSPETCWEWIGARTRQGYGLLNVGRVTLYAHRVSWQVLGPGRSYGEYSVIGHTCGNPPCINPGHLVEIAPFEVRQSLYAEDVASIRERYAAGVATQAQLASEYGVSRSLISRVVNGKRHVR